MIKLIYILPRQTTRYTRERERERGATEAVGRKDRLTQREKLFNGCGYGRSEMQKVSTEGIILLHSTLFSTTITDFITDLKNNPMPNATCEYNHCTCHCPEVSM